MKTGVVVSAFDPTYKNRIKVRVYGLHTEQVDGNYVILDDDLPWFLPAPGMSGSNGSYAVPTVGSRVYVDGDGYNWFYYNQVEVKGSVKSMLHNQADQSDRLKVIAFSEDFEDKDESNYMKIYYLPENGLTIECMGHKIILTKYDGVKISSKEGCEIEMTRDADINITTRNSVNLKCGKLNLTEGSLDEETTDRIVLGSRIQEIFNNHYHFVSSPGGVTTTEPIDKIKETDFSKNIRISNGLR